MCLAVPAKIIQLLKEEMGIVELEGLQKEISLALVPEAQIGDYVIVHVGFALSRMDQQDAEKTLQTLEQYREIY